MSQAVRQTTSKESSETSRKLCLHEAKSHANLHEAKPLGLRITRQIDAKTTNAARWIVVKK
jgi:hypothetical protein